MNKAAPLDRTTAVFWKTVAAVSLVTYIVLIFSGFDMTAPSESVRRSWFTKWMGQSVFNGQFIGVSDIPIFLGIGCLAVYLYKLLRRIYDPARFYAVYILVTNLTFGVLIVHGLKFVIGRARPYLVAKDASLYSTALEFGAFWPGEHLYSGSFPSGHTAAMMSLLPFAFMVMFGWGKVNSLFGRLALNFSVLIGASAMAVARYFSGDHYLTDCVFSVGVASIFHLYMYSGYIRVSERMSEGKDFPVFKFLKVPGIIVVGLFLLYLLRMIIG